MRRILVTPRLMCYYCLKYSPSLVRRHLRRVAISLLLSLGGTLLHAAANATLSPSAIDAVVSDPTFSELLTTFTLPTGITVHLNLPSTATAAPDRPSRLILYALPNGNSIAWTVGKRLAPGDDWHYAIQHIGAQTRLVRELLPDEHIVVAYLEAPGRSWPTWRRTTPDAPARSKQIIHEIATTVTRLCTRTATQPPPIELFAHSGGGSFIFAFMDSADQISSEVRRIVFLDANYGYSDELRHGDKLIAWLRADPQRTLMVAAYDDREVTLNGKPIVGPTGGTWRATHRMIQRFAKEDPLTSSTEGEILHVRALGDQAHFYLHTNPKRAILHTVLVERNGFAFGALLRTKAQPRAPAFFGEPAYTRWISE
ncbi:MAG: hypothetical protein D6691_11115 [Candidatus Hydrogenedentota bacterium]|nr:MAG: hypothetical protein D6691_11115 [Candidatus Hydrogenedentota bacterium]